LSDHRGELRGHAGRRRRRRGAGLGRAAGPAPRRVRSRGVGARVPPELGPPAAPRWAGGVVAPRSCQRVSASGAAVLLACATWVSTGLGGAAALRYRDRLHILLGFSAGAVLGVVFFDLMPEVFALGRGHHG